VRRRQPLLFHSRQSCADELGERRKCEAHRYRAATGGPGGPRSRGAVDRGPGAGRKQRQPDANRHAAITTSLAQDARAVRSCCGKKCLTQRRKGAKKASKEVSKRTSDTAFFAPLR